MDNYFAKFDTELSKLKQDRISFSVVAKAGQELRESAQELIDSIHKWKNESILLGKITPVLSDAYVRVSPEGYVVDFNTSACKLYGVEQTFAIGKHADLFLHNRWTDYLDKGKFFTHSIFTIGGKEKTVFTSLTKTANDYVFLMRDVDSTTGLDVAELAQMLQNLSDVIIVTNSDNNIVFVNEAFTKHTGYTREEVIGKNPSFMRTDGTPPSTYEEMWKNLSAARAWSGVLINKAKDTSLLEDYVVITPILKSVSAKPTFYVSIRRSADTAQEKNPNLEFNW